MRRHGDHGRRLSAAERLEIRHCVATGETFGAVAAAVGCSTKSIQRLFVRTGGLAPRVQVWSPQRLSLAEREEISRGLRAGDSRESDRSTPRAGAVDGVARRRTERGPVRVPRVAG